MQGATEYYHIIKDAHNKGLGSLRSLNLQHGWHGGNSDVLIHKNIAFVISTHARGECFHILFN